MTDQGPPPAAPPGAPPEGGPPPDGLPPAAPPSGGLPPGAPPPDAAPFTPAGMGDAYATLPPDALGDQGGTSWVVAGLIAGATLIVGGGVGYIVGSGGQPAEAPAPSASAPPPPPPSASAEAPKPKSDAEKAAEGDTELIAALEKKGDADRTAEEALAIARGRNAESLAEVHKLGETLRKNPQFGSELEMLKKLRGLAKDPIVAVDVLKIVASLEGSGGADVLYDIWVGTRGKTVTTEASRHLLLGPVREKASPSLQVALELRKSLDNKSTEECASVAKTLEKAAEHGDRRSLHLIGKLNLKFGCGEKKTDDCWQCVRGSNAIKDAIKTASKNLGPRLK